MDKIKVMIVEDSKLMQDILSKILSSDPSIEVVGIADDPLIARELIKEKMPDVLTLDVMLPHMDGITFLKNLMRLHPMPVIMVSTLTKKASSIAIEALAIGAIDYLVKPTQKDMSDDLSKFSQELISMIKTAVKANVAKNIIPVEGGQKLKEIIYQSDALRKEIIGIGASTGGIEAIETILLQLPQIFPPVIIVQHIKKEFGVAFSNRIRKLYGLSVVEPDNHMEILPGYIYIAPGGYHLMIQKHNDRYFSVLSDTPAIKNHKPAIDVLFRSMANAAGKHAIGILLTGMGSDGAEGLKAIRDAGGTTIVQDKESSVVWGMPGTAVKLDAVDHIVSLNHIPQKILQVLDIKMQEIKTS